VDRVGDLRRRPDRRLGIFRGPVASAGLARSPSEWCGLGPRMHNGFNSAVNAVGTYGGERLCLGRFSRPRVNAAGLSGDLGAWAQSRSVVSPGSGYRRRSQAMPWCAVSALINGELIVGGVSVALAARNSPVGVVRWNGSTLNVLGSGITVGGVNALTTFKRWHRCELGSRWIPLRPRAERPRPGSPAGTDRAWRLSQAGCPNDVNRLGRSYNGKLLASGSFNSFNVSFRHKLHLAAFTTIPSPPARRYQRRRCPQLNRLGHPAQPLRQSVPAELLATSTATASSHRRSRAAPLRFGVPARRPPLAIRHRCLNTGDCRTPGTPAAPVAAGEVERDHRPCGVGKQRRLELLFAPKGACSCDHLSLSLSMLSPYSVCLFPLLSA